MAQGDTDVRLYWFPTWRCQNYAPDGSGVNPKCPYCNLGVRDGRLTVAGVAGSSTTLMAIDALLTFCRRNAEHFGRYVVLSGGEPWAHPTLEQYLAALTREGWRWAITSNTTLTARIQKAAEHMGGFGTCDAWTASYHPHSGSLEKFREGVRIVRGAGVGNMACTVVIDKHTIERWQEHMNAVADLGWQRLQVQVDMNEADLEQRRRNIEAIHGVHVAHDGYFAQGVMCDQTGKHLVVAPNGTIYHCLTKAYQGIEPIGHATAFDFGSLETRVAWCGLYCSLPCDIVKHVKG